jgi:threonine/homoserine/homoserine lactone efflux protein
MDIFVSLLAIVAAILLGAMSPGPSFVLVVRTAVASKRNTAIASALGMGVGGIVFATAAVLGLHVVLSTVPALYFMIKIAGAGYLLYVAAVLWKVANDPLPVESAGPRSGENWRRSFSVGLATQLSNPKTAVVYASIFTAFLSADRPTWFSAVLIPCVFIVEFGWYALVAAIFSSEIPRRNYLRGKRWVDRAAGAVMALLALRLVADMK